MRILLVHPFPLAESAAGRLVREWTEALGELGHEVRLLIVDERTDARDAAAERVICREADPSADLPYSVPRFTGPSDAPRSLTFSALTSQQLALYRERFRRKLDAIVARFDPQVIHVQHVWIQGQLTLETGVPYVLNAWPEELAEYARDARYQGLADQAAENASRILVPDASLARRVAEMFEAAGERVSVMPPSLVLDASSSPEARRAAAKALTAIYQVVLDERFGNAR